MNFDITKHYTEQDRQKYINNAKQWWATQPDKGKLRLMELLEMSISNFEISGRNQAECLAMRLALLSFMQLGFTGGEWEKKDDPKI